jgi:hypothetical protein
MRFLGWTIQIVAILGLFAWVLYFYGTPYEGVRYLTGWGFWTSYLVAAALLFIPVLGWLALLMLSFVCLLNVWEFSLLQAIGFCFVAPLGLLGLILVGSSLKT